MTRETPRYTLADESLHRLERSVAAHIGADAGLPAPWSQLNHSHHDAEVDTLAVLVTIVMSLPEEAIVEVAIRVAGAAVVRVI